MTAIKIEQVDYANTRQAADLVMLLDHYAQDPMGGAAPLSLTTRQQLAEKLADFPTAFSIIAYVDGKPAGLTNCFYGFSTFAAKKLVNIHDVTVLPEFRGMGLSKKMLAQVEAIAIKNDCCKMTLEVLSGNRVAMNAYKKVGFEGIELDEQSDQYLFWQKKLA